MSRMDFRPFVPAPGQSRIAGATARAHASKRLQSPRAQELFETWHRLAEEPFRGLTADGRVRDGLYALQPADAPAPAAAAAVLALFAQLSDAERQAVVFPIDAPERRRWQNTEILIEDYGLRLDEIAPPLREAVMAVVEASLSQKGHARSRAVMRLNGFLGELVGGPGVLGEWSYIFCLFGEPDQARPWGWQLFGHHLSLNCLFVGGQMVLSPTFFGAEPNFADAGPWKGLSVFEDEERQGLALMRSLAAVQQDQALVSHSIREGLPPGRWHFADQLHLGGAHRDNRVVPFEGLPAGDMTKMQRRDLLDLVECYVSTLPPGPLSARMEEVERHMSDTHFCWIGSTDEVNPFYYRIQSPVIFVEFDHHSGVFLTNEAPARFHVHTIVRTPNGNDYGMDLLRLHYEESHRRSQE